jgi:hypothetical protein
MEQTMKRYASKLLMALAAICLIAGLACAGALLARPALADPGAPSPGAVGTLKTYTFEPTTQITGTTTVYSTFPLLVPAGQITYAASNMDNWHAADVFVTGQVASTKLLTVTAQLSPDGVNWANAFYRYVAPTLTSTSVAVSHSGSITSTTTTATTSSALVNQAYQLAFNSTTASTSYFQMPVAGEWLRFQIQHTGTVTPTIVVTLRSQ